MNGSAGSEYATRPSYGRRSKIRAYTQGDDGSKIRFEIEWSGYLQRWVIGDAYNDVLTGVHRNQSQTIQPTAAELFVTR